METGPLHTNCAYCGKPTGRDDLRARFCSDKCLRLFEAKSGLMNNDSDFSFSSEMQRLQKMVYEFAQSNPENTEQNRLAFYEDVVERTGKVLKWINANSLIYEERTTQKLRATVHSNKELERKLERLLERAAELKRENKQLRKKVSATSVDTLKLSRLILGVSEDADKEIIKKAYRNKAKNIHPDREHGDPDLFKAVTEAMVLLIAKIEVEKSD